MRPSLFDGKVGVLFGIGLFIIGISGGIIFHNPIFSFIALFGAFLAISSLAIFGLVIPLLY